MSEVSKNYEDHEYMKDLKQKVGQGKYTTFKCFNGDLISIHKGLTSLYDYAQEEDDSENKYSFLSDKTKYDSENIDFSDKGALLKRQREILSEIEQHEKQKEKRYDPFYILKAGLNQWFIILCLGGKFCIAKIQGDKIVDHKSDSKYVQRKKGKYH